MPRIKPSRFPDLDVVRERITYDPLTGLLTWNDRYSIRIPYAGAPCGSLDSGGYVMVSIQYVKVRGHQIAWALMTGAWPTQEIDHRNGAPSDNRWSNLRTGTHGENMHNLQKARRDNKTGLLGVHAHANGVSFYSEIKVQGRRHYLGCFDTAEKAHAAYLEAKAKLHVPTSIAGTLPKGQE